VMLGWLRRSMGDSQGAMAGALGVFNDIYHPGAVRAREQLDGQNERVIPVPSPGDRLLEEGKIVIQLRSA
jgi:hypothetical protein